MIKKSIRIACKLFKIAKLCHKTTSIYSTDYFAVFLRSIRLCRQKRFSPEEAFRLGLFKPTISSSEFSKYVSRKKLTKVQESLNPPSWAPLTKNKSIFYKYCMALGVPVPDLYAIYFRETPGWSFNNSILTTRDDWKRFFDNHLPQEFVIKPVRGAHGRGVNIFRKTEKGFIDTSAKLYKTGEIYDLMFLSNEHNSFLIQERLKNHPELIRLSDTQYLQTVRMITLIDSKNKHHILQAHLKLIMGQSVIDSFEYGLTGNIQSKVFLGDGVLKPAVKLNLNGSGIKTISAHPKTGVCFDRFHLPMWPQVCQLVKVVAPKFLPIRTIGWDIALTETGPFIVEANIWWDPVNQHGDMKAVFEQLQSAI